MLMSKSIWKAKKKYMFLWWIEKVVCRPPGPGHGTVEEYDPVLSGWEITVGWGSFSIMTFINHENHFHSFASDRGGDPSFGRVVARSCKKRGPRYFACHQPKSRGKKGESIPHICHESHENARVKKNDRYEVWERALSLSLEPLFIHTSSCLMSDYFCTLLPSPDKTSANLS